MYNKSRQIQLTPVILPDSSVQEYKIMAQSVSTKIEGPKKKFKGKKFRVAIIGCGGIAQTHLNAYKQIPEVEIVAGVDIDPERLKIMEETWGVPKNALFTDWKKMLKEIKPDAVDVCTPNGVHCAPVVDACLAGCHAIVEKPMAMNPAECEKMIAAAKKAKSNFPLASSSVTIPVQLP